MMTGLNYLLFTVVIGLILVTTRADTNCTDLSKPPQPEISKTVKTFLKGESFTLNCTAPHNATFVIDWKFPSTFPKDSEVQNSTNVDNMSSELAYRSITVLNAGKEHAGTYACVTSNNCGKKQKTYEKIYLDEPKLKLRRHQKNNILRTQQTPIKIIIMVDAYPPINKIYAMKDNERLQMNSKYRLTTKPVTGDIEFAILDSVVTDTGNYTIVASNTLLTKSFTIVVQIPSAPEISVTELEKKRVVETTASFMCEIIGFPLPNVTWVFSNGVETQKLDDYTVDIVGLYKLTTRVNVPVRVSGDVICRASNEPVDPTQEYVEKSQKLLVYDIDNGFGITKKSDNWFPQDKNITKDCLASVYDFKNVTWLDGYGNKLGNKVKYSNRSYSMVATLNMDRISLNDAGNYTCLGLKNDEKEESETMLINVLEKMSTVIIEPDTEVFEEVVASYPKDLHCLFEGVPLPKIEWHKDGNLLSDVPDSISIETRILSPRQVNSSIHIYNIQEDSVGKYECIGFGDSNDQKASMAYTLTLHAKKATTLYLIIIFVISAVLFIVICCFIYKIRKDKEFKRELAAAGLLYFKEGATKSLNPHLGIDEQAELLPYDDKFEFPPEKLKLGIQLGAGAFGVVYRAEAKGIIDAEQDTTVAVKMVKSNADNMYIKALASELKIMVHLGKHVNIVNLLGACTKRVGKRELSVIVEYCKYGNIHKYMQSHREVFIDQLNGNQEKILGKINRGFSSSTGSAGTHSDYFSSMNTQDTAHTFLHTGNTNRSTRKVSEGYVMQPEWRSNYQTDYSYDSTTPRPLTSRDLITWAFQIARGMDYLASRKVLHGDLAARNVLLAEDNVVKICDFGLARSIYKNDEYQKKENSPLPVKWLALECLEERIFSTQSDVWAFGIVLWELFSLAKTPYPNVPATQLLDWLKQGNRLSRPSYADDRLHEMMMRCWQLKPTLRPSFAELQELLGSMLADEDRNYYVELDEKTRGLNKIQDQEDYLAMVCAPDYKNLVTPSPREYVNMNNHFFPPSRGASEVDQDGYLKISPRVEQHNAFDYDAKRFARNSDASSGGSELTPMLPLNNLLPRSGSDSDHDENVSPLPNLKHTRIEEEDEVFEEEKNLKNLMNTATNPEYIIDIVDKKPKDISSYVNVPNCLVK